MFKEYNPNHVLNYFPPMFLKYLNKKYQLEKMENNSTNPIDNYLTKLNKKNSSKHPLHYSIEWLNNVI